MRYGVQAPPIVGELLQGLPSRVELTQLSLALGELDLRFPCLGVRLAAERTRPLAPSLVPPRHLVYAPALALDGVNRHRRSARCRGPKRRLELTPAKRRDRLAGCVLCPRACRRGSRRAE